MKRIIVYILLLTLPASSFSQQTTTTQSPKTKDYYLQKSKNQKSGARVLLGGGSILIVAGVLIGTNKDATFGEAGTGLVMGGLGFLATLGSIPLFIASSKNKRKAMNASSYFKFEKIPSIQGGGITSIAYPAVSLKINL